MYLQVIKDFLDEMEVQKEKVNAIHGPHQPHGPRCVRRYAVKILIYLSRRSKDSSVPLQAQSGPRFTAPVCAPNIVKLVMYISKTLMVPGARAASNGRAMPPSPPLSERYELYLPYYYLSYVLQDAVHIVLALHAVPSGLDPNICMYILGRERVYIIHDPA